MNIRLVTLIALAAPLMGIPNSAGPIRLVSCVVNRAGLLEAEVENTSDAAQVCNLRCDYTLEDTTSSHWFEVSIPARFSGIVGQFDTSRGRPGSYSGRLGNCRSTHVTETVAAEAVAIGRQIRVVRGQNSRSGRARRRFIIDV